MSQWLREGKAGRTDTTAIQHEQRRPSGAAASRAGRPAGDISGGESESESGGFGTPSLSPDPGSLDHILAMTREMKKLAQKAGLMRIALILEMAELEALDHRRQPLLKPPGGS